MTDPRLLEVFDAILEQLKAIHLELSLLRQGLEQETENATPPDEAGLPGALSIGRDIRAGEETALATDPLVSELQATPALQNAEGFALAIDGTRAEPNRMDPVLRWLAGRGITVKNHREDSSAEAIYDQLAVFLGDRFHNLLRLHEYIRRSLSTGESFRLNLASRPQEEIADSTQFCTMLNSYAFLAAYKYNRVTKTLYAAPQRVGNVINFFTGGWFERYIFLKIHTLLSVQKREFCHLVNPQITFANGDDFELDLLFLMAGEPLWIECKTGDYQAYITKYSDMRKLLSIPRHRSILVILNMEDELTRHLTQLYDITVANQNNLVPIVQNALGLAPDWIPDSPQTAPPFGIGPEISAGTPASLDLCTPTAGPGAPPPSGTFARPNGPPSFHIPMLGTPANLSATLNKAGLRPLPELRPAILRELIGLVSGLQEPCSLADLKNVLALRTVASKSQLQDVLNAVVRSGGLVDVQGNPFRSFTLPFAGLVARDIAALDAKCIESYAYAVLTASPRFFESNENRARFEGVVGGRAPGPERIQELLQTLSSGNDSSEL